MKNRSGSTNHYISEEKWLERELGHVKLGDKRLIRKLIKTSVLIEGKASGSINQSFETWKKAKGLIP